LGGAHNFCQKILFSSISLSPGLEAMEGMKISQMSTLTDMVFPMALYKETRVQMRKISDLD